MSALLELPLIDRVPRSRTVYAESPLSAHAALAFFDSPFGAHAAAQVTPTAVINAVLRGWLAGFTTMPEPPPSRKAASLAHVLQRNTPFDLHAIYSEPEDGKMLLELQTLRDGAVTIYAKTRLRQAEQLRGLGQSALSALAHASDAALPILLPETLASMAGNRKHLQGLLASYPGWVLKPQILAVEDAIAAASAAQLPRRHSVATFPLRISWESDHHWDGAFRMITDDWAHTHRASRTIYSLAAAPGPKLGAQVTQFLESIATIGPILQGVARLVAELNRRGNDDD